MKVTNKIISLFTTAAFIVSCNLYGNINKVNKTATAADKIYTADGGFSADEIAASPVKPTITLTKKVISIDEAGETQQIDVMVSGADLKYCSTGIYIEYDPRIQINLTRAGNVDAICQRELLGQADLSDLNNKKSIRLITAARGNYGYDGVLWSFNITLPSDAQMGDTYLFDIFYCITSQVESLFYGREVSKDDKLMSAYTFTQGIYNKEYNNNFKADIEDIKKCSALADIPSYVDGYIAIADNTTTTPNETVTLIGDANMDGKVSIADSTAILQFLGNPDKYGLSKEGEKNADCYAPGSGVTIADAITIQKYDAKLISILPIDN
ncbi:MAG: hypothetical protein IJN43_08170 [Ruminococcus sp.]|nr:hypothetical protein [Ruminococcus sp.]